MWTKHANCADQPPEWFFPERGARHEYAKAIKVCKECAVRAECLAYALERNEQHGMWGGKTPEERQKMPHGRAQRVAPRFAKELTGTTHGTHEGYSRGCRCLDCTQARHASELRRRYA